MRFFPGPLPLIVPAHGEEKEGGEEDNKRGGGRGQERGFPWRADRAALDAHRCRIHHHFPSLRELLPSRLQRETEMFEMKAFSRGAMNAGRLLLGYLLWF